MAATKKTAVADEIKQPEQVVVEESTNNNDVVEQLKAQNAKLQAQFEQLMALYTASQSTAAVPQKVSLMDEVTIVHLVERAPGLTTFIKLSNVDISLSKFGEKRLLTRQQAEELVGKYRGLFDNGTIAFGAESSALARQFVVNSVSEYKYATSDFIPKLGSLNLAELEDLYNSVCDGHKQFIIEYFKRKFIEKDPNFYDIHKIELLNRLSGDALSDCVLDYRKAN